MKTSEAPLRPRSASLRASLVLTMLLSCLLVGLPPAYAADSDERKSEPTNKERVKELETKFKAAKKSKDENSMRALLDSASDLFEDCCDDEKLQEAVIKFAGKAHKGVKGDAFDILVIQELAEIGDLRAAKYIKPFLRQRDKDKTSATLKAAIEAAAKVPDPSLVKPLLKLVEKSEHTTAMNEAVYALGKFRGAKRYYRAIFETLCDEARKVKPGNRPRMRGNGNDLTGGDSTPYGRESGPGARWSALSRSVPAALRELTGQEIRDIGEWMHVVKNAKGKYDSLFVE